MFYYGAHLELGCWHLTGQTLVSISERQTIGGKLQIGKCLRFQALLIHNHTLGFLNI